MSPPCRLTSALFGLDGLQSLGTALALFLQEFWPIVVPVGLGLAAVYLLLPRVRRYPPLWGAMLGSVALIFAGWSLIQADAGLGETILFYAFSAIAVVSGVLLITQRNPARAALSFALVVLSTCGLFLLQAAPFLMAATIIIYAGAIVVTFLFVLMLAQQAGVSNADQRSREPLLSTVAGFILLGALLCVLHRNYGGPLEMLAPLDPYFHKAEEASRAKTMADADQILGGSYFDEFLKKVDEIRDESSAGHQVLEQLKVRDAVLNAQQQMTASRVPFMSKMARLRSVARIRYPFGSLQPSGRNLPLSGFSGLRPNVTPAEVPTDEHGKPALPAQNVAALGKSLFTDYLLAVELAGTLLLVATIGAIAIAARRPEGLR